MCHKSIKILVLLQIIATFVAQQAFAGENEAGDLPWEKVTISLGGFSSAVTSSARVGTTAVGLDVDFEEALGLESSLNVFRLDSRYRLSKNLKHAIDFSYYDMRRSSSRVLETDFEFQGNFYTAGTTVSSYFNMEIFKIGYNYSYFLSNRVDLSVGGGLFVMPLELGIDETISGSAAVDLTSALPYLSFGTSFAILDNLFLKQQFGLFYLEYDAFEGGMVTANLALEYNFSKHVGVGLAVDSMRVRITAIEEDYPGVDFTGQINYSHVGLMLYAKMIF